MKTQVMKLILLAGATLAIISSCSKEAAPVEDNKSGLKKIVLSAGAELLSSTEDTKVYFDDWSTYQLYWANQDNISVFSGSGNYEFTNTASAGTVATFKGEIVPASSYTALYPYNSSATLESGVVSTTFPAAQAAAADGTAKEALLAVAVSDGDNLNFKNIYGIVKFEIVDDDITSVTLEGNNGEVLAGDIDITVDATPSYVVTGNPSTEIILTPSGSSTFVAGDYAIAVLPVDFTHGFKLIFTHTGSIKSAIKATKDQSFTVARNGGLNAKEMEFESTDYKYYYIRTKEDLDAWKADIANWEGRDRVYLANDIDYDGGTWETPPSTKVFNGLFDGRGYSITNIDITASDNHSSFLRTVTGAVKNLTIGSPTDNSTIRSTASSSDRSMGIVATLQGGSINNVVNYADLYMGSNTAYCGGIVGRVEQNGDKDATIKNCKNYASLSCTTTRNVAAIMGGIAGNIISGAPSLKNNENYGSISFNVSSSAKKANIGGIAGQATCAAEFADCFNGSNDSPGSITVNGSNNTDMLSVGGILGFNQTTAATISGCYNYASITNHSGAAKLYVGGLVGAAQGVALEISDSINEGDVLDDGTCSDTYASNTTVGESRTGGILGWSSAGAQLTDCRNNGSVENNSASVYMNVGGILGLNTGTAATLLRCINTNLVKCTPVNNNGNQVIRLGGMVAMSSVAETSITYCENYGDVTLANSYTILRAWVAGGIGYCKYPFLENGKYYSTISRGAVSGGQIAVFVGQSDTSGGTVKDNGLGGSVNGTVITSANYNTGGGIQFGSKSGSWTRTSNYFLESKPVLSSAAAPAESISGSFETITLQ